MPSWCSGGAQELREAIQREGPDTVSAVIMEPVISSGGFIMPPIGWLRAVRAICDELDVLLIADEVITGFGRTGRWFAVEHDGVVPDIMSVAKGITSGYIPLSAAIARRKLADAFPEDGAEGERPPQHLRGASGGLRRRAGQSADHGEGPPGRERRGDGHAAARRPAAGRGQEPSIVGEVRGRGLMVCVELVEPDGSGRPLDAEHVAKLDRKAWERGAIVYARGQVLRLAPPLCITREEVDQLVGIVGGKHRIAERRGVTKR